MTIEELKDQLLKLIKKNPSNKDVEVMIVYWDDVYNETMYGSVEKACVDLHPTQEDEIILAITGYNVPPDNVT